MIICSDYALNTWNSYDLKLQRPKVKLVQPSSVSYCR